MRIGKQDKRKQRPKRGAYKKNGLKAYDARLNAIAEEACASLGATNDALAKMFGVTTPTIHNWFHMYPDFYLAVKRGKDRYDGEKVESSLLKRAMGYTVTLKDDRVTKDGMVTCEREQHIPADVDAAKFWLANRNPERWRSIQNKIQQLMLPGGAIAQQITTGEGKEGDNGTDTIGIEAITEIIATLRDSGALNATGAIDVTAFDGSRPIEKVVEAALK